MCGATLADFDGQLLDGLTFCTRVYEFFERIRATDDGPSRLRMRESETEKRLIEELFPLCKFVQSKYRAGRYISIKWVNGSQQYDAEVSQSGRFVELGHYPATGYLEVTGVMHKNEHLVREILDDAGVAFSADGTHRDKDSGKVVSEPTGRMGHAFIASYSQLVIDRVGKKARMDYPPNTTLIVHCTLNTLYMPSEWEELIRQVRDRLPEHSFQEIFIYDAVLEQYATL